MSPPSETNQGTKNRKQGSQRCGDPKQDKKDNQNSKNSAFHGLSGGKDAGESSTDDETDDEEITIRDVNNKNSNDDRNQEDSGSVSEKSQVIFQERGGQGASSNESQDQGSTMSCTGTRGFTNTGAPMESEHKNTAVMNGVDHSQRVPYNANGVAPYPNHTHPYPQQQPNPSVLSFLPQGQQQHQVHTQFNFSQAPLGGQQHHHFPAASSSTIYPQQGTGIMVHQGYPQQQTMSVPYPPNGGVLMQGGAGVHQPQQTQMHHMDTNNIECAANDNGGVTVMSHQDVENIMEEVMGGGGGGGGGVSRVCK